MKNIIYLTYKSDNLILNISNIVVHLYNIYFLDIRIVKGLF